MRGMRGGRGERAAAQFGHLHQPVAAAQMDRLGQGPEAAQVAARVHYALGAISPS